MSLKVLSASIVALALALVVSAYIFSTQTAVGSVSQGSEYYYLAVDSQTGTSTLKSLPGVIGSIVIDEDGTAGLINFYATTSQATSSADLVLSFDGVAAEGTYTYDISIAKGILVEEKGFDGEAVITYR